MRLEDIPPPSTDAEHVESYGLSGPALVWANTWETALPARTAWDMMLNVRPAWRPMLCRPDEVTPHRWYANLRYFAVRAGLLMDVHLFLQQVLKQELKRAVDLEPR